MSKCYQIPTFLGETVPVDLVTQLQSVSLSGNTALLQCASGRYEPHLHNSYGTLVELVFEPAKPGKPVTVRLDFCTEDIIRVRYYPGSEVPDIQTPMVVAKFEQPIAVTMQEDERCVTFETSRLRLVVIREPFRLEVYNLAGKQIWGTRAVDIEPLRRPKAQWNPPQERWLFMHRYAYPLGSHSGDCQRVFASFDLHYNEHIYGLGEDFGPFDKRGVYKRLWVQEAYGNASPAAYKYTPFYMSTRGYGLYVNTSNAIAFHVGDFDYTAISTIVEDTNLLDFYFIYGPTLKEILPRYTAITGQPAVPPKWSFGLWLARITYNSQEQVEQVAKEMRAHRIPCDVIHIDTGWYNREWEVDLCFGEKNFPDPHAMTERLHKDGFRLSLWQCPNIVISSPMFHEGSEKGYLVKRPNGKTYTFPGFLEDAGLIDYSNPEAISWLKEKFFCLFRSGVSVIKADFGEGAPPDAVYYGYPSESMHNLYPLLYNKAIFEMTEEFYGKGQGIIWARSAWAGSQRYPVHWSGDGIARFEDLACVLRSALSFGMSGFPFYSHDLGGFCGLPCSELYVRWAQLGFFSSHTRTHGQPPREPWFYGEQAENIFRRYDELRYRLLPYIYSEAVECGRTSLPMVRALVLEYQEDEITHKIEDQYLFGSSLLVAPILDESNRRKVYLPQGTWVNYWSKEVIQGGCWIDIEAPLDILPLFVRGGAILPFGPVLQHTEEKPCDPLTIEIYAPSQNNAYTIYTDAQTSIPVSYKYRNTALTVHTDAAAGQIEIALYGITPRKAQMGTVPLSIQPLPQGGCRVVYDGRQPQIITFEA